MNTQKRVLSLLLAFVMVLGLLPVREGAAADSYYTITWKNIHWRNSRV